MRYDNGAIFEDVKCPHCGELVSLHGDLTTNEILEDEKGQTKIQELECLSCWGTFRVKLTFLMDISAELQELETVKLETKVTCQQCEKTGTIEPKVDGKTLEDQGWFSGEDGYFCADCVKRCLVCSTPYLEPGRDTCSACRENYKNTGE